ncbi:MAG: sugar ABC transporter permease [Lachnospiraceae bacterium]|jgi:multiple sugar transport system permease protein|nr:sugar ABC transporter permease [Lachnospiraceae bacterium]MCI1334173.1 sugar ABC transporter permease [Lachnospiraceae bacterium]MCI1358339.1 sugar ABC transporter permease [Lachnospiraceae bacterium]MCI1378590.1 sugar ABC transporter permease [Lachnospiraceae bacterium]MCI1455157.1 sugar ABC transporter permease [Lachnospiraceae bacterium]
MGNTPKKMKSVSQKQTREGYAFILPAFIYLLVVVGYPIVYNFVLSFKDLNVQNFKLGTSKFVGFQNYAEILTDPKFQLIFRNTIIFTVVCLVFQFSVGFLLAIFFSKKFTLAGPVRGLLMIGYMMPMSVTGLLGQNIFSNTGLVNDLLSKIGIAGPEWLVNTHTALIAVIIMNCWVGIPFNMLLLISGLTGISPEIYESSALDGATKFQQFRYMTLPLMKSSIAATLMLGFIYTFRAFDLMYIMTSGGPLNSTDVLGTYSYELSFTQFQFSKGSTVAIILFICLFIVGLFYLRLLMKEDEE